MPDTGLLVINAGSSSIKFSLFHQGAAGGEPVLHYKGQVEGIGAHPQFHALTADGKPLDEHGYTNESAVCHASAFAEILRWVETLPEGKNLAAVGHRVVHGGLNYAAPVLIDDAIIADLEKLIPLAPLHQPHNLAVVKAIAADYPGLKQVACFDTAFHRTHLPVADLFALPRDLIAEGVRRYGFHGLSYEYVSQALAQLDAQAATGRVVVAHLGNGSSMCAIKGGKSIDSTMGFTAIDGLPMGTRTGAIDPGVLLYLMDKGMNSKQLTDLLYKQSGLKGVSGFSSDMRELLASPAPEAAEAVELYCYRINRELGALSAAQGGLDALVFTAGIGEHAAEVRARVCRAAAWMGIELDEAANAAHGPKISTPASKIGVWVIPTDEEKMIARHTRAVLAKPNAA